jgi:tRNA nucleotidyltransferase (CCA-adding enzyme)
MQKILAAAMNVDAGAVASAYDAPEKIKAAVFEARLDAVKKTLSLL